MTDDILTRAEKACEGVTEGPWEVDPGNDFSAYHDVGGPGGLWVAQTKHAAHDAAFIAASRQLLPDLAAALAAERAEHAQAVEDWGANDEQMLAENDRLATEVERLRAAVERVRAVAEAWRYKGEFGWGPWQAGEGPDHEGYILDQAAYRILAALDEPGGQ